MNSVKCVVSDAQIWNKDQFIIDLVSASKHGPVTIDLLFEGPCIQSLGLDDLIDKIPNLIVSSILTSNQILSSKFNEIRKSFVELEFAKNRIETTVPSVSSLDKLFAIFIGRSNWQRLALASHLWKNYKNKSLITYHYNSKIDYHIENFGLEVLLQKYWNIRHTVYDFLEALPMTLDDQSYPILWDQQAFNLDQHYTSVFCEIVCETFFTGKTFMMTEKIMRPIIQRRPFIIQGPKFFIENLKILGFKTFDSWWDESYDIDESDSKFESIQWTIDYIGKQPKQVIQKWYQEMQPTLEHNANVLKHLTNNQIISTKFKSE